MSREEANMRLRDKVSEALQTNRSDCETRVAAWIVFNRQLELSIEGMIVL